MHSLALASLFFFSTGLHAEDGFFSRLCGPVANEMARAHAVYVKACEQEMKSLGCDRYFTENFVPREYKRDCNDPPGLLSNSNLKATAWCPVEFGTGVVMGDLIIDPLVAVYEALKNDEEDMGQPAKRVSRHDRAENYRRAIREQVDYLALPREEKLRLYEEAQAEADRRRSGEQTIKKWLSDAGIAIGCYNDVKYKELLCYGAGAAVGTIGIVKGVKYLGNLAYKGAGKAGEWGAKIFRAAGVDPSRAKFLADATAKVEFKLGYRPNVSATAEAGKDFVALEAKHPEYTSTTLAKISGDLEDGGKTVSHLDIRVLNDNNFDKGLSGLLLAEMLQRYPKITKISTHLTGVNQTEVVKNLNKGMTCIEAIMESPSYKIRRDAGFTKFVGEPVCRKAEGVFYYVVERP